MAGATITTRLGEWRKEREFNLTAANVYAELALIFNAWLAAENKKHQGVWVTSVELLSFVPLDSIFRFTYLAH
jgi:hypothetical protein